MALATSSHVMPVLMVRDSFSLAKKISAMVLSSIELGLTNRLRQYWEQYFGGVEDGVRGCVSAG